MKTTYMKILRALTLSVVALTGAAWGQMCVAPSNLITWIYEDSLVTGWGISGSWNSSTITNASGVGQTGATAIQTVFQNAWGGVGLYKINTDLTYVSGLQFRIRVDQPTDIQVGIHRTATNSVDKWVSTSQYIYPFQPFQSVQFVGGQWYKVFIPLLDLQLSTTDNTIKGFVFMSSNATTMYIDDVQMIQTFLKFPLQCSNADANCAGAAVDYRTKGAYTPSSVVSVMDHSMKKNAGNPFYSFGSDSNSLDGVVVAWTGETGTSTVASPTAPRGCYPMSGGGIFAVAGTYASDATCGTTKLNYDDHPGYDYRAELRTPVYAAASGVVVNSEGDICYRNNLQGSGTCSSDWGAVGVDAGNGYIYQYLHLDSILTQYKVPGASVTEGALVGYTGHTSAPGTSLPDHFHFEVLKKVTANGVTTYKMVDPYGWASGGVDPLQVITGEPNVRLWK